MIDDLAGSEKIPPILAERYLVLIIHVIEKDGNTGLPRHFVPRKDTDHCGSFNLEMELQD